jgi:hypothetical protein
MILTNEFLFETAEYVRQFFEKEVPAGYCYHNYNKTVSTVQACSLIGVSEDLSTKDRMLALLSSWFLFTGYAKDARYAKESSAHISASFLSDRGLEPASIAIVRESILETRLPAQPLTKLGQVLCDAENAFIGEKDLDVQLGLWRNEQGFIRQKPLSDEEWLRFLRDYFDQHWYFTEAAQERFGKRKNKNRAILDTKPALDISKSSGETTVKEKPEKVKFPGQQVRLERGVESLFRNTSRNQMRMIQLADYKANLIISVNALIVTVILSLVVVRLDANKYLEIPTLLLMITSVSTIVIAISGTRPRIKTDGKQETKFSESSSNMLYFGHFYKKTEKEYKQIIRETMLNQQELYDSLTRDLYFQGMMLIRRYRYIILAYDVFATGLIISIIAFIVFFLLHNPATNS